MRKLFLLILSAALILSACGGSATPTAEITAAPDVSSTQSQSPTAYPAPAQALEPTPYPAPAQAQAATPYPAPAAASVDPAASASSTLRTYKIVPAESTVTYEVGETFIDQGNVFAVAVGVTPQIEGDITIDPANPQNSTIGPISVDISQFKSDSSRRDNAIRERWLESRRYPIATFTPTQIDGLPAVGQEAVDYNLTITGDLLVRDTTRPVTFNAVVRLEGDTLTGQATTTLLMSDFAVGPISLAGVLNTQDEVKLTLQLVARP